jgi:DNA recombination protein RmuC
MYSARLVIKAKRIASHLHRIPPGTAQAEQVALARQTSEELRPQTQQLVTALRRPEARGRWGESQLRWVAELAGMSARCDFDEQVAVADGTLRPDMVVRLASGKNVVADSKVPLAAFLEAAESDDDTVRADRLVAHARHLREHVDRLADRAWWAALSPPPEFVILFIPSGEFLAPALERDPGLLEYALSRKVHIATPTTLAAMLRTAHYAWQQDALAGALRDVYLYVGGEPDDPDSARLHQHLDECEHCTELRARVLARIEEAGSAFTLA